MAIKNMSILHSASSDESIKLWNFDTGLYLNTLRRYDDEVMQ